MQANGDWGKNHLLPSRLKEQLVLYLGLYLGLESGNKRTPAVNGGTRKRGGRKLKKKETKETLAPLSFMSNAKVGVEGQGEDRGGGASWSAALAGEDLGAQESNGPGAKWGGKKTQSSREP